MRRDAGPAFLVSIPRASMQDDEATGLASRAHRPRESFSIIRYLHHHCLNVIVGVIVVIALALWPAPPLKRLWAHPYCPTNCSTPPPNIARPPPHSCQIQAHLHELVLAHRLAPENAAHCAAQQTVAHPLPKALRPTPLPDTCWSAPLPDEALATYLRNKVWPNPVPNGMQPALLPKKLRPALVPRKRAARLPGQETVAHPCA